MVELEKIQTGLCLWRHEKKRGLVTPFLSPPAKPRMTIAMTGMDLPRVITIAMIMTP